MELAEENKLFPKIKWIYTDDKYKSYSPDADNIRYHEAGYDALITGQVFLKAFPLLTKDQ